LITSVSKYLPDWEFGLRFHIYLKEMYPVITRLMTAAILYFGFTLYLSKIAHLHFNPVSHFTVTGIAGLFSIALILRLMDELKDRRTDLILFKDRPLPSGKIKETDIKFALVFVCLIYICLHLYSGRILLSSLFVLAYAFLMFRYFFLPEKMHDCLLINLATHNPITALILLHLAIIFTVQYNLKLVNLKWLPLTLLVVMFWFLILSWEISRKIRYEHEETDYITYSKIFGKIKASVISFLIQTISFGIAVYLYFTLSLSVVYLIFITIGYKILVAGYISFILKKMSAGIKLRSLAEFYSSIMMLAIIIETSLTRGL